jgi:hypothetical protein
MSVLLRNRTTIRMNYHEMCLADLKEAAKNHRPKIKQYYIKKRHELIQLLTMNELPAEMVIAKRTLAELRKEAQDRELTGFWKLRRSELVELLYPELSRPGPQENNKDHHGGEKHNHPEKGEGKQVGVNILEDSK